MSFLEAESSVLRKTYVRFSIAIVAVLATFLLRWVMWQYLGNFLPFITFYPAIVFVALLCGFWPGLLATAFATLLSAYWVLPLRGNLTSANLSSALALTFFFAVGTFLSEAAEHYRRNHHQIADFKREHAVFRY